MKKMGVIPRLFPAFFVAVILLLAILLAVSPRQAFSPLEKRYLAKPPALTTEGGQFSRDMEAWLGDHFPFRANWVGLDAQRRVMTGAMVADEIWRLGNGALVQVPLPRDWERLERNLALLSDFAGNAGLPLSLVCPPSAGAVSGQAAYYPWPDGEVLKRLEENPPEAVRVAPLFEAFRDHALPLYYRTDPHWNGRGAYLAYCLAAPLLGIEARPASEYIISKSPDFLGGNYSRSGLWDTTPDTLEMWDAGQRLTLTFDKDPKIHDSLFFMKHLTASDQYPVFLDGNHGLTDIQNPDNPGGPVLMMLKDSFGNSLVPLLTPHFSRVIVLDLRAYRQSPLKMAQEAGCGQILAVYSLYSLATDANLAWLMQK